MTSSLPITRPRGKSAHWLEPLTASGAAQACPLCLPSPANQLTSFGDLRPTRPMEKARRFAPEPSPLGGVTVSPEEAGNGQSPQPGGTFSSSAFHPGNAFQTPARSSPFNPVRKSDVTQDSDFRTKSRIGKNGVFPPAPPGVRRPSENLSKPQRNSSETPTQTLD